MKTTLDIQDELLARAERFAKRTGRPLQSVVEDGLRQILPEPKHRTGYKLRDCSVGNPDAADPLETLKWQNLLEETYGNR